MCSTILKKPACPSASRWQPLIFFSFTFLSPSLLTHSSAHSNLLSLPRRPLKPLSSDTSHSLMSWYAFHWASYHTPSFSSTRSSAFAWPYWAPSPCPSTLSSVSSSMFMVSAVGFTICHVFEIFVSRLALIESKTITEYCLLNILNSISCVSSHYI